MATSEGIPTVQVESLDEFVVAVDDPTNAQLAVGASMRHIWKDERQAPFYYITRDAETGAHKWAIAQGAYKSPWDGTYNGPHTATATICNNDRLRRRLPAAQAWADMGPHVVVLVVLDLDNESHAYVSYELYEPGDSADDLQPLVAVTVALNKELDALFYRRRLLFAAVPYLEKDKEPVVLLMVCGLGTPIDETPLPSSICGVPTRIVVGKKPSFMS